MLDKITKKVSKCDRRHNLCDSQGDLDNEHKARARKDFLRAAQVQAMLLSRANTESMLKEIQKKDRMRQKVLKCLEVQHKEFIKLL